MKCLSDWTTKVLLMLLPWLGIVACNASSGPIPVKEVVVTIDSEVVRVGGTATVTAELLNEGRVLTGRAITWSSSAPAVATVAGTGNVVTLTALTSGTTSITATSEGVAGSVAASVTLTYSQEVRADAPVAYWRFEEVAGAIAIDSSGHNRHGNLIDSPALDQNVGASTGRAFGFLAETDGVVNGGGSWTQLASVSAEAWIRPNRVTTPEGMIILDKGGSWNLLIHETGLPAFHFPHTDDWAFGTTTIEAGQTYHLVGTYAAGVMKLYVNGQLVRETATLAQTVPDPSPGAPIHVGRGWTEFRWEFYGIIDEPAIYDRALSAVAIMRHYEAGK